VSTIVSTIQQIIRQELRAVRVAELGLVEAAYPHADGSDADNYACDVRLKNSDLLLKRVPVATGHIGTAAVPNVGDLVLLNFDKGDINQPIIVGRLYNDDDRPPLNRPDEVIFRLPLEKSDNESILASVKNHADQSPPRELLLQMPSKMTVKITDGTITATAGKTEMKLDNPNTGGGKATVVAGGTKITMDQDGDVQIEAVGSMSIKASGNLSLEATSISIRANANLQVEASGMASVKADGMLGLQAGGATTVQGAVVDIKGVTNFSP
jgi:phage baseplate assembly protein gpV